MGKSKNFSYADDNQESAADISEESQEGQPGPSEQGKNTYADQSDEGVDGGTSESRSDSAKVRNPSTNRGSTARP